MSMNNSLVCPNCKEGVNIQKASVIVDGGVTTISYESTAPITWKGETYHLPVSREATSHTILARKLVAPEIPEAPKKKTDDIAGLLGLVFSPFIAGVVVYKIADMILPPSLESNEIISIVMIPIFIIAWAYTFYNLYKLFVFLRPKYNQDLESRYQQQVIRYENELKAIGKWQKMYYCHKCGSVFIPGERQFASVDRMRDFIHT